MAALSAIAEYDVSDVESGEEKEDENQQDTANVELVSVIKDDNVGDNDDDEEEGDQDISKYDIDVHSDNENEEGNDSDEDSDHMIMSSDEEKNKLPPTETSKPAKLKFKRYSCESATALAVKLQGMTEEEVRLPPEPDGRCTKQLQDKIKRLFEKKIKEGENLNQLIQDRKDFRNPSIYDKLILYLKIEERGTNFPKSGFDPSSWRKAPDYEDLTRAQREDVAKRERDKKTKVEFVTGTVKKSSSGSGSADGAKKTKWDTPADDKTQQSIKPPASVTNLGSKTTIISAVGTIKKPKP